MWSSIFSTMIIWAFLFNTGTQQDRSSRKPSRPQTKKKS
ncbi:unnamed protein product [Amoebophrya sp. A25]|nr:unnamed protein product [Amoebophrya sp. A25]|eukprot:GSA25T00026038001.1